MQDFFMLMIKTNFIPIAILSIFCFFIRFNNFYEPEISHRFSIPVFCALMLVFFESLSVYYSMKNYCGRGILILNTFRYDFLLLTMLSFLFLALRKIKYKYKLLIVVPFVINFFVLKLGIIFDFGFHIENGIIVRDILGYFSTFTGFIYAIILFIIAIYDYGHNKQMEATFIWITMSLVIVGGMFEILFKEHYLNVLVAFGTFSYYLFFHIEHFKYDVLTDALNRGSFDTFIHRKSEKIKIVFSIDMNNLKTINDSKGHLAGDKALIQTANGIKESLPSGCFFFRTGGDEFVVLVCSNKVNPNELKKTIEKNVEANGASVAIGFSKIEGIETFESAYIMADSNMYENKKRMKERFLKENVYT